MIRPLLFTAALVLTSTLGNAQITITSNDIAGINTLIKQAQDTMPTVTPGPAGANQTWNFSGLNTHVIDTLVFADPAQTPGGASFPTSNLVLRFGSSQNYGLAYLQNTTTGLFVLGSYDTTTKAAVQYNPDEKILGFPSTYGSSFTNTYGYELKQPFTGVSGFDSIWIKNSTNKNNIIDGWGTVTTPLGNFDALRSKEEKLTTDSVYVHATGPFPPAGWYPASGTTDTSWSYAWWANGVGFPLVEIDSNRVNGLQGVRWLMETPTPTDVKKHKISDNFRIYPNPSSGSFNIAADLNVPAQVELYDMTGRLVKSVRLRELNSTVNCEDLNCGMLIYKLTTIEGTVLYTGSLVLIK